MSNPQHIFVIFGDKILYAKHMHKTLMKLTPDDKIVYAYTMTILSIIINTFILSFHSISNWRIGVRKLKKI